ncbi:GT2 family glycosyltransferase [Methylorubrum pseudosasae]|nr:GT2 family glycosyltransferase [Methylorubrum pseudosasae]
MPPVSPTPSRLDTLIAIPVRNEAERIARCLTAIDRQTGLAPGRLGLVLFLNNCTDDTAEIVARLVPALSIPVRVIERVHAGAHAGWARRAAMDAAVAWLEAEGTASATATLLTTDADSIVPPDWVAANLAALEAGADAVAGRVELIPEEAALLPPSLPARGRLEDTYDALITEMEARIDPDPHDPWPCHRTTIGASLAVRLPAYRDVGGMPEIPLGEDGAFVGALLQRGFRVRHDRAVLVLISARLTGRAAGGRRRHDPLPLRGARRPVRCPHGGSAPRALPLRLAGAAAPPLRRGPAHPRSRLGAPARHHRGGSPPHRRPAAGRRDRRGGRSRQPAPRLPPADAAAAPRPDPARPPRAAAAARGSPPAPGNAVRTPGRPNGHRRRVSPGNPKGSPLWRGAGAASRLTHHQGSALDPRKGLPFRNR